MVFFELTAGDLPDYRFDCKETGIGVSYGHYLMYKLVWEMGAQKIGLR